MILERQDRAGWGAKIIDRLAADLSEAYPEMKGFSPRNLLHMRAFAEACPDGEMVKQLVSQLLGDEGRLVGVEALFPAESSEVGLTVRDPHTVSLARPAGTTPSALPEGLCQRRAHRRDSFPKVAGVMLEWAHDLRGTGSRDLPAEPR